jgi:hypothetical protein
MQHAWQGAPLNVAATFSGFAQVVNLWEGLGSFVTSTFMLSSAATDASVGVGILLVCWL